MTKLTKQGERWQLSGAVDRFTLTNIWSQLTALPANANITLDLTQLGRVDSAGLAGLVQLYVQAEQQQVALNFENVPRQLCRLAQLFNVDVLLSLPKQPTHEKIEND
ncbi:STAS domain-containing protein [Neiella marina]|uniref:STAS domain-containing protein n=1 Tax=Neiella holothuriorum TaxID=2870530 RepID=A0ABS7EAW2_9GAMM|nr:STAS domain-containing protein [Neiella holothuriorum]MBW8189478.1 STAS domain-containing protein [Neiella holothuriorum]